MEQPFVGNVGNNTSYADGQHPFDMPAQADFVHYVFPLRIVAPPGVERPRLPRSFDPLNAFNGFHHREKKHGCDRYGDEMNGTAEGFPAHENGDMNDVKAEFSAANEQTSDDLDNVPLQGEQNPNPSPNRNPKPRRKAAEEVFGDIPSRQRNPNPSRTAAEKALGPISPRKAVINTLRLYHALCRNFLYEEEDKGKDSCKASRPDLNAGSIINMQGLAVNRSSSSGKVVGPVPGVEVGDQFYFRMEICCIGMHGPLQAGIDYLSSKASQFNTPIAISIISSGGYAAKDDGEVLIYTGQGGRSALDSKPTEDQKLERGNLALEGSMKHRVPIRVIRGVKNASSPTSKIYTYDGLYSVEECWSEKGKFGFDEFKFKLHRLPGQPELGSALLKLSTTLKCSHREGLRLDDISNGKEAEPICVVNSVDDLCSPSHFEYSTSLDYPHGTVYQHNEYSQGCDCVGACKASQPCSCFLQNGNAFSYLHNGILVKERGLIHECGINCKCSASCRNRSTQRVPKCRLEIFKTEDRGWGLRSWDPIPAGSFICEYTGKLVENAQSSHNRDYILNVGRLPSSNPPWGHVSDYLGNKDWQATQNVPKPQLMIDSSQSGNAARFINHSCSPNVLVQCVLRNYTMFPHVMLFAMDNIPPFRELTIDYGSDVPPLNRKQCLCKSADCRGTFCS